MALSLLKNLSKSSGLSLPLRKGPLARAGGRILFGGHSSGSLQALMRRILRRKRTPRVTRRPRLKIYLSKTGRVAFASRFKARLETVLQGWGPSLVVHTGQDSKLQVTFCYIQAQVALRYFPMQHLRLISYIQVKCNISLHSSATFNCSFLN